VPANSTSQDARSASVSIDPRAWPGPISAPATSIQDAWGELSFSEPTVTLVARGASASASNRTNQIEPFGSSPGRLWTVWRIQIP
jgi:hypothetical protein